MILEIVPAAFQGEEGVLLLLVGCAVFAVCLIAVLLWLGPRMLGASNLQALSAGKERLDAEAGIRESLLKTLGIFGSIVAATAVAFSYIDKVNAQNEGAAAQSYFDAIKTLQGAPSEEQKALSLASIAAIARNSRSLTPMAMDLFATYIRSSHHVQSPVYQLQGFSEAAIPSECRNLRARFPSADVDVIVNSMSTRKAGYDRADREWNLSGLDLHSAFFASGFAVAAGSVLFTGSNLSGAGFQGGLDLTGAHFDFADLACVTMGPKMKLTGARFLRADLRGATLAGVDLSKADLTDADLRVADFTGSNLDEVDLRNAKVCRDQLSAAAIKTAKHVEAMITVDCF